MNKSIQNLWEYHITKSRFEVKTAIQQRTFLNKNNINQYGGLEQPFEGKIKRCLKPCLLIAAQFQLFDDFNKCVILKVSVFCAAMESRFLNSSFIVNFSKGGLCECFWILILVVGIQIVIYDISKNNSHKNNGNWFMGWRRGSFHKEGNVLNPISF